MMSAGSKASHRAHRLDYYVADDAATWQVEESGGAMTIIVDPDPDHPSRAPWFMWLPSAFFAAAGLVVLIAVASTGDIGAGLLGCGILWAVAAFWGWSIGGRRKSEVERHLEERRLSVSSEGIQLEQPRPRYRAPGRRGSGGVTSEPAQRWIARASVRGIEVRHGRDIPDQLDGGEEGGWIEIETDTEPVTFYVPASAAQLCELAQALRRRLADSV